MSSHTQKYWFILGNNPELSAAEIGAVLNLKKFEKTDFNPPLLFVEKDFNAKELIAKLGGTIKIATELGRNLNKEEIIKLISEDLTDRTGKIHFGLSDYGEKNQENFFQLKKIGLEIKKSLKQTGLSVRFAFNNEQILSSVSVEKNDLIKKGGEYIYIRNNAGFALAKTVVVQPFEAFGARDFGRPGRDDLSGMLPPKLALMMLNLAKFNPSDTLLDPFCGSGTIITEALILGAKNIFASDLSERAVKDTEKNVEWLKKNHQFPISNIQYHVLPVENLSKNIKLNSIDKIVTEPFLGKPLKGNEKYETLVYQANDLKKLYLQAFIEFKKILKFGGKVIFVIPCFKQGKDWIKIDLNKDLEKLGFVAKPLLRLAEKEYQYLLYARPDQKVGREIWHFLLDK